MKTEITKNAKKIIQTFSNREKGVLELGLEYIREDIVHILMCEKEIKVYESEEPEKYRKAIIHQTNMLFRAKYLLGCLDLYIYENFETQTILVKSKNDK
jgi:hypothetical protein